MQRTKGEVFAKFFEVSRGDLEAFASSYLSSSTKAHFIEVAGRILWGLNERASLFEWATGEYQDYLLGAGSIPIADGLKELSSGAALHLFAQEDPKPRGKYSSAARQRSHLVADRDDWSYACFSDALYYALLGIMDPEADQVDLMKRASGLCSLAFAFAAKFDTEEALAARYEKKRIIGLLRTDRTLDHDDAQRALIISTIQEELQDNPGVSQDALVRDIETDWEDGVWDVALQELCPDVLLATFKAPKTKVREWVMEIRCEIKPT